MCFKRELIYGDPHSDTMAEARALKWRSQKKKGFCRLPPDKDTLTNHLKRVNYLSYLCKHPSVRVHPSPVRKGWEIINNSMKPVRYTKPALPEYLYGQTSAEATETETEITNVYGWDTSDDIVCSEIVWNLLDLFGLCWTILDHVWKLVDKLG